MPSRTDVLILELGEQRTQLIAYLLSKIKAADWHASADACMDLREIDAKLSILNGEMHV